MKKRILLLLPFILIFLLTIPVLAEGLYRATVTIEDTSDEARSLVPVLVPFNTQSAIDMGFLGADGLDTRFLEGTTERGFMVAEDKIGLLIPELLASQEREYRFETGWTPEVSSFSLITGTGGFSTFEVVPWMDLVPGFNLDMTLGFDPTVVTPDGDAYPGPVVASGSTDTESTLQTSHEIDLPSGIEVGDLLLCIFGAYESNVSDIDWPAGWTELDSYVSTTEDICTGVAYTVATGSEGSTITVDTDDSCLHACVVKRITGYVGVPEISTRVVADATDPDPAVLTPTWGDEGQTLWIACFGAGDTDASTIVDYPADYDNGLFIEATDSATSWSYVGYADRNLSASSENPGAFDTGGSLSYSAWTIGVRGLSILSLVELEGTYTLDVTASGELTFDVPTAHYECDTYDSNVIMYSGSVEAVGQRFDGFYGKIEEVQVWMVSSGSPPGDAYCRVRNEDDTLLGTLGSIDADTIGGWTYVTFTNDVTITTPQDVRITIEYNAGGDASNYIRVGYDAGINPEGKGYWSACTGALGTWSDTYANSIRYKMDLEDDDLVATGVSGTSLDIDIYDDGGTLKLDVEGSTEDSIVMPWQGTLTTGGDFVVSAPSIESLALGGRAVFVDTFTDPSSHWADEENAYDWDTSTYANPSGTGYLELELDTPVSCNFLYLYAYADSPADDIDVDVYYSSAWHDLYDYNVYSNGWKVYSIGSTETVSEARLHFQYTDSRLYEFYFGSAADDTVGLYEPDSIVQGTTLENEEYDGYEGFIAWGDNYDLTIDVGGLVSITSYTSEAGTNATIPSVSPDLPDLDLFPAEDPVSGLPWYSLVNPAAIGLEWSTNTLYSLLYIFIAIGVGVGVMIATGSALLGSIATGAGLAVAAGTGVTGWWIVLFFAIFAAGYLVVVRSM